MSVAERAEAAGPGVRSNPLAATSYTQKVINQMAQGDNHSFPKVVDNYGADGELKNIIGGDGIQRQLLRIQGSYNGKDGVFEYIIEPDNMVNHRMFWSK